jgi:hypothetical protein
MQAFMQDLAQGAFTYAPPTVGQLSRAMEVDRCFADLGLGLVDSTVVALASHSASVVWPRATCATSPPFDSVTAAALIWWFIRWTITSPRPRASTRADHLKCRPSFTPNSLVTFQGS